jgi:alanyl-tRNA synthetase
VNAIPCTGTHVKNTREVGRVRVVRAEPVERGFKLVYSVVN